jgi:hypothetical protein
MFLMIKWHSDQFVDFCVLFSLILIEYYEILVGNNKNAYKVLNCGP